MTSRKSIVCFFAMFLTIISISITAQEPNGVSKFQDVKAPGATETDTYAVNNFGVIAGAYVDTSNVQHGMILNGQMLTTVDRPGCLTTPGPGAIALFGLNSKELAVGWCFDTSRGTKVAFEYNHGHFTLIAPRGAISTQTQGINDKGQVVGSFIDMTGAQHGFLLTGTKYTTLNVPGHTSASATGINNRSLITVYAVNGNGHVDSFLTTNGTTYKEVNVGIPGVTDSIINGLNNPISTDAADRIYTYIDSSGQHGALFVRGTYNSFDDPKARAGTTRGYGVNDKLEIIGDYTPATFGSPSAPPNQGFSAYGCCRH